MRVLDRPTISVEGRRIGGGAPAFLIAEIGTAHGGDLGKARALVDAAAAAGADCAKFQAIYAEEIIHPNTGTVELPGGSIPLFDRFRDLERNADFYAELKTYTESAGLFFLCTPFGPKSAAMLAKIGVRMFKVASPELNYDDLLRQLRSYRMPIILSSGVSTLGDIEHALEAAGRKEAALLHCVTAYPAAPRDYNLRVLPSLERLFGVPVGVSDHSTDPLIVPSLATAMGARIVEKHITLSSTDSGLDDPIALNPVNFRRMAESVRRAEREGADATIERLVGGVGAELVEAVLGDGIKSIPPSEGANYATTNRSLHAVDAIRAGSSLRAGSVAILRSEKNLRPGLPPAMLPVILGKRVVRDIAAGEGIVWDDLLAE